MTQFFSCFFFIISPRKKGKHTKRRDANDVYDFDVSEEGGKRVYTAGEMRRILKEKALAEKKKGYCEICQVTYNDLKKVFIDILV